MGALRVDKTRRTLSFPAFINMDKGIIEYLMVTRDGSTHESLLVADVAPQEVHTGMLLLGAKGAGLGAPDPKAVPPSQLTDEYLKTAPKLKGDDIVIRVSWSTEAGEKKNAPVESWIVTLENSRETAGGRPLQPGSWLYTGSMFGQSGRFLAQAEGVFAAMVTNPSALINNPRSGNDNDEFWAVNEKTTPPANTPVEIQITLSDAQPSTAQK